MYKPPRANDDIRAQVKAAGLYLWQIADRYGVSDGHFHKLMRREFSPENKQVINNIIAQLVAERADI